MPKVGSKLSANCVSRRILSSFLASPKLSTAAAFDFFLSESSAALSSVIFVQYSSVGMTGQLALIAWVWMRRIV